MLVSRQQNVADADYASMLTVSGAGRRFDVPVRDERRRSAETIMPSRMSLFLIGSLALNAALLGIVGGRMAQPGACRTDVQMQLERYGPTADVVAAAWDSCRRLTGRSCANSCASSWVAIMEGERKRLRRSGRECLQRGAWPNRSTKPGCATPSRIFQLREKHLQDNAEDILISHLGKMPPQARATAATGLLTPFNARMQRADKREASSRDGVAESRRGRWRTQAGHAEASQLIGIRLASEP
jgi:hypothetical protein